MGALRPLLARNRYTDEEWAYASSGHCDWEAELGMHPRIVRCGKPSSPDSFYRYCTDHDEQARESPRYGR